MSQFKKSKNFLITLIARWAKKRSLSQKRGRYLLVSTTGLGDAMWATPAIRALRKRYPKAYIAILTNKIGETLFSNNPHLDKIYTVHAFHFPLVPLLFKMRKEKFSTILYFHFSQRIVVPFCHLLFPKKIIGIEKNTKGLDHLLDIKIPFNFSHYIDNRLALVAKIGAKDMNRSLEFFPTEKEKKEAHELILSHTKTNAPLIALHPCTRDPYKQWPIASFAKLGKILSHHLGAQIFITGTADEIPYADALAKQIPGAINVAGKLSIRKFAAFLGELSLFVSGDTGPAHIAAAMQAPLISLFSPTSASSNGPPPGSRAIPIHKTPTCTPCLQKKCSLGFCMMQISVEEVAARAIDLYYQTKKKSPYPSPLKRARAIANA